MTQPNERKVAIVGGGPVGLFAVFALGQVGLESIVIDTQPALGGQCAALYPTKPIYDIPTHAAVTGGELVSMLRGQAAPYDPEYVLGRSVETIEENDGGFRLGLSDKSMCDVSAVVLAVGAGAFGPNRPPIDDLEKFEPQSVYYAVQDPSQFAGQDIVIAGGGDSAIDWAVILSDIASSVTIVHRRPNFRAAPATLITLEDRVAAGKVRIAAPRQLAGLEGRGGVLEAVRVIVPEGGEERLSADALLCFYGLAKDLSALSKWDIGADRNGVPVDPATMSTKRPGVFAIGDIATYPGKLKLILTGFSEGSVAGHAIRDYLFPDRHFHFEYSTTRGDPAASHRL